MPLYEYECQACRRRFEQIQKFSDPSPTECPHCGGGPIEKLISSPAIQFKGSGFYITDYARSGNNSEKPAAATATAGAKEGAGESSTKSDAPATSTKSEGATKTETAPASTTKA